MEYLVFNWSKGLVMFNSMFDELKEVMYLKDIKIADFKSVIM